MMMMMMMMMMIMMRMTNGLNKLYIRLLVKLQLILEVPILTYRYMFSLSKSIFQMYSALRRQDKLLLVFTNQEEGLYFEKPV